MKWKIAAALAALVLIMSISLMVGAQGQKEQRTLKGIAVVIDAGHGGIDGGVMGRVSRTPEAPLNLDLAKRLEKLFKTAGCRVVMTRTDDEGLYGDATSGRKKKDMQMRGEIIRASGADLFISIHMNSFPDTVSRGAQVFFRPGCDESQAMARSIQDSLKILMPDNKRQPKAGDFYVLKQDTMPSVLVECGFLSQPDEERLLLQPDYRSRVAWSIYAGSVAYLTGRAAYEG